MIWKQYPLVPLIVLKYQWLWKQDDEWIIYSLSLSIPENRSSLSVSTNDKQNFCLNM